MSKDKEVQELKQKVETLSKLVMSLTDVLLNQSTEYEDGHCHEIIPECLNDEIIELYRIIKFPKE